MTRLLLADDHPATRVGLLVVLADAPGLEVVGEASTPERALELAVATDPELVITDLRFHGEARGAWLCARLKELPRPPAVLVYTGYSGPSEISELVVAGADGYVHKSADTARLLAAVRATAGGGRAWVLEDEAGGLEDRFERMRSEVTLTPREEEVLYLVLHRYSNEEIAERLFLGRQTVKNYVRSVLGKLGMNNRRQLFG